MVWIAAALVRSIMNESAACSSPPAVKQAVPRMPRRGFKPTACFDIWLATFDILGMLYDTPFPIKPQNDLVPTKAERNAEIRARYGQGETVGELATRFGVSEQRVSQILRRQRHVEFRAGSHLIQTNQFVGPDTFE